MRRGVASYLDWLGAGNESAYLDAVRSALAEEPQTRAEIAERAGVSHNFAATALDALVVLGHADERGRRRRAKLYARREVEQATAGGKIP